MISRIIRWYELRRQKALYNRFLGEIPGSQLERVSATFALVHCQLREGLLRKSERQIPLERRASFRAAFQCYVAFLVRRGLRRKVDENTVAVVMESVQIQLAARASVPPGVFGEIWDAVQSLSDELPDTLGADDNSQPSNLPWKHVEHALKRAGVPLFKATGLPWLNETTSMYHILPSALASGITPRKRASQPAQLAPEAEKDVESIWLAAVLAECASADAILDEALGADRRSETPFAIAALQSLLAHAANRALQSATPHEAPSVLNDLYKELTARSHLSANFFHGVWVVVFRLLDRQAVTGENATSVWARVVFELQDAGYDARHITDILWVMYTSLIYPNFKIRIFEAAGGRNAKPTREAAAKVLASAKAAFQEEVHSVFERVVGEHIGDVEFRRTSGAVVTEENLRAIKVGRTLVGSSESAK